MSTKPIDSTTKILQKIQADMAEFRREVREEFRSVNARFDTIEEHLAGTAAVALEARGIAERLKERIKRMETRD